MIRVGTAGWDYDDWYGPVYPDPAPKGFEPLGYLARYFPLVEVNSTFYRPLPGKIAKVWCARVRENPDFRFTLKLWRRFTHERAEPWSKEELAAARELPEALAAEGRLGALLLQFPWSFKRDEPASEWLHDLFGALKGLPLALEVRHASWDSPAVYEDLAAAGVGFVNVDQPRFKRSLRPSAVATSPVGYVRVHGRNFKDWFRKGAGRDARYDYLYSAEELTPWAARARSLATAGTAEDVYVVTNNHFRGQAAANAVMLDSMVKGRPVPAPAPLVRRYSELLGPFVSSEDQPSAPAP